jgi:guanosine-3',5'-bis(diphosphate) 3'-pyrophosphohydrolase
MSEMSVEKALLFATEKHKNQKRKFDGESYVKHCIRVAECVREELLKQGERDDFLVISALLHDTLEDTNTTIDEITLEFGKRVATIVVSLTNNKEELDRIGKTEYLANKINTLDSDELLIKLADRMDNISDVSMERYDWSHKYASQTKYVFLEKLDRSHILARHEPLFNKIKERIAAYT